MQNITVKITKGRQLKAYLKSGTQGAKGADGLQGEQGLPGVDGLPGIDGQDGKSAYQIAAENGFAGTEQDWLLSLKGEKGDTGEQGLQGIPGNDGAQGIKGDNGETGVVFAVSPLQYVTETKTIQVAPGYIIPSNSGDGTKYLTNDGSFKTVSIPPGTKIGAADSKAEITDIGNNGLFSIVTDNITRMKINEDFHFGDGTTEWTSGTEHKCFFDKSKGAFRAGVIDSADWSESYRGIQSAAFGIRTKASGLGSASFGQYCTSSGTCSLSQGYSANASGDYSFALGNTASASGYNSVSLGLSTYASGGFSQALGRGCSSSGDYSRAFGYNNTASGYFSTVIGAYGQSSGNGIPLTLSCGYISSFGDAQCEKAIMSAQTTDATQTVLNRANTWTTSSSGINIPAKSCWSFVARVSAYKSDYTQSADFEIKGQIKRDNSNNTSLVWSNNADASKILFRNDSGWDAISFANDTSDSLEIKVTGSSNTTIKWCASIDLTEVKI